MNQHVTTRASQDRERNGRDRHHGQGVLPSSSLLRPKEGMLSASPEFGYDDVDGRSCGTFGSSQVDGCRGVGQVLAGLYFVSGKHQVFVLDPFKIAVEV
jgi:hypothetical protein